LGGPERRRIFVREIPPLSGPLAARLDSYYGKARRRHGAAKEFRKCGKTSSLRAVKAG
jgi:hypothetical protein